ncbi:MAG: cupin domain-containing protein, partial [Beijerinckiaceae bacterium]
EGNGEAVLDDVHTSIHAGFAVLVPAGTRHNIINTGDASLKLYTLYAPPNHRDGIVHKTRADAERDTETFDGKPTERRIALTMSGRSESIPVTRWTRLSLPSAVSLAARS